MHAGGKGERETEETIWMPVSVLVLLKDIPNFPMLNIVLGYFEEGVDCFIRQELMGLRKLAFKIELEQKKKKKQKIDTSLLFSSLFPCFQHINYSNSDIKSVSLGYFTCVSSFVVVP